MPRRARIRPFTPAQAAQNAAFLGQLAATGNARLAAAALGVHRATYSKRRARDPAFAAAWDKALAQFLPGTGRGTMRSMVEGAPSPTPTPPPTTITHLATGRTQLRRPSPGRITPAAEQAFLAALSAAANVRLSAAAAGFAHSSFYARARRDPGFAREMRLALQMGYDRLEAALLEGWSPDPDRLDAHPRDAWRRNDPPAIPPMTAAQALQLLYLHQKEARLFGTPEPLRRRRGESEEARSMRLSLMYEARLDRDREAYRLAEAARRAEREPAPDPPVLPDLAQVTGWSKARPEPVEGGRGVVHDADRALFGGWRLKDWKKQQR